MFQGMEYVYEVYKEKSFSKAAASLFISQPSLSANVKRIEKRIGCPIFDRSTKPLQLTECGLKYIESVEQIMEIEKNFRDFIRDWGELKTGTLNIGGSNFFSSWVLPPLIADFSRKYPFIKISLVEESTANLSQLLQTGKLDFMIDNCILDERTFDHTIYQKEQLLLVVPKSFPVNQELTDYQIPIEKIRDKSYLSEQIPAVPVSKFTSEPFIFLKNDNDTGKRAFNICQENHFSPDIAFQLDQQMTAYNITCSGMGITFIGDMLLSLVPINPELVFYKLPGNTGNRNVYFYWKKGRYLSRVMNEFLKMLQL